MESMLEEFFSLNKAVELAQRKYPELKRTLIRDAIKNEWIECRRTSDRVHAQFRVRLGDVLAYYEEAMKRLTFPKRGRPPKKKE